MTLCYNIKGLDEAVWYLSSNYKNHNVKGSLMTQGWYGCTMEFYRGLTIYTIVFKITHQESNLLMDRQLHHCVPPILKAGIHTLR